MHLMLTWRSEHIIATVPVYLLYIETSVSVDDAALDNFAITGQRLLSYSGLGYRAHNLLNYCR